MKRTLQVAAGCLSVATLLGAAAVPAYADYPGYGGGKMGPEDSWAQTHPNAGKMPTSTRREGKHAHQHHQSSTHNG